MISEKDCTKQVRQVGNQVGLLYYHFAKTLVNELGEAEGKRLILEAIRSYGNERGATIREKVENAGLELTIENFAKFSDLPSSGWEYTDEGTTYCCYAEAWMDRGVENLGRLYCEVDFALIKAYNPKIQATRVGSILDGDPCCKMVFE
ncbi:MAG: L-2-amino-thiazoline-4-carboxylic acid hydrolase [Candidatus Hermodarchaeota archaeon]|nr:L-2-amino-thiazoline-4-carboxylic acid hydrolase [Candidatus Hermodarchaeota archaeon]